MSDLERLLDELIGLSKEFQHLAQFSDLASRDQAWANVEAKKLEILDLAANQAHDLQDLSDLLEDK